MLAAIAAQRLSENCRSAPTAHDACFFAAVCNFSVDSQSSSMTVLLVEGVTRQVHKRQAHNCSRNTDARCTAQIRADSSRIVALEHAANVNRLMQTTCPSLHAATSLLGHQAYDMLVCCSVVLTTC